MGLKRRCNADLRGRWQVGRVGAVAVRHKAKSPAAHTATPRHATPPPRALRGPGPGIAYYAYPQAPKAEFARSIWTPIGGWGSDTRSRARLAPPGICSL